MTPPPIPSTQQKKKTGCFGRVLKFIAALFVIVAIIGFALAPSNSNSDAGSVDREASNETATPPPPKPRQETAEVMVERIVKEETIDRFISTSSVWNEGTKGWIIHYRAKMPEGFDGFDPDQAKREMIKIAARCHPEGMIVSSFVAIYDGELTDGLGNDGTRKVLQCEMVPGIASKINWGDKEMDLYKLSFDRIFTVENIHPTVKEKWKN